MVERGYEGYVAKDDASPYEGGPTRRWLKVKQKGWTDAEDRWQRRISDNILTPTLFDGDQRCPTAIKRRTTSLTSKSRSC